MNFRKTTLLFLWCSCCCGITIAQVTVRTGSVLKSTGTLTTNTSLNNASTTADFSGTELLLTGVNQSIFSSSPLAIKVSSITMDGGGIKTFSGNWEVTETLNLNNGIVDVPNGSTFLYSGSDEVQGTTESYVKGYFTTKGTGRKFFPIGSDLGYSPAVLESFGGDEIQMRVVLGDAGVTVPEGVLGYFDGHYWETNAVSNSAVSLSIHGAEEFISGSRAVVLQSGTNGSTQSLLGNVSGEFVTSEQPASNTTLTIGKMAEFTIVIHDLITPFTLGDPNDKLVIENIDLTATNNVKLIDRWGLVAAEYVDYRNDNDYDFSVLSPGNYVCLVEYSYPGETRLATAKSIVTVLKTK